MNDIHGYVGAYVTHALDDELRLVFAEHLEGCESCRREVREFRETLAELSVLEAAQPTASLRGDVLAGIKRTRIEPPDEPDRPVIQAPDSLRSGLLAAIAEEPSPGRPDRIGTDRDRRPARASRWLTLAVAASLLIAVVLGGWAVLQQRRIADLEQAQQAETELLRAPDLRSYPVELDGAHGSYLVSLERNEALFTMNVPAAGQGKDYQLWTLRGGAATPGPVFDGGVVREWLTGIDGADTFAISVEADGGSATGVPNPAPKPVTTPI